MLDLAGVMTMVVCVGTDGGTGGAVVDTGETVPISWGQASTDPGETGICSVTALWPVESMTFAITFLPPTFPSATQSREFPVMRGKSSSTTFALASMIWKSNGGTPSDQPNVTVEQSLWAGMEGLLKLSADVACTAVRSHIRRERIRCPEHALPPGVSKLTPLARVSTE